MEFSYSLLELDEPSLEVRVVKFLAVVVALSVAPPLASFHTPKLHTKPTKL